MTGYRVDIRPEHHCGIVWLSGPHAIDSLMQSTDDVATHPDWSTDFDIIVVIGADSNLNDVTLETLMAYQSFIAAWSSRHRTGPNSRAATVCDDDLKRVIVELWLAVNRLATGVEDAIYPTLEAALAGLARPKDS